MLSNSVDLSALSKKEGGDVIKELLSTNLIFLNLYKLLLLLCKYSRILLNPMTINEETIEC